MKAVLKQTYRWVAVLGGLTSASSVFCHSRELNLEEIRARVPPFYAAVEQANLLGGPAAFFDGWTSAEVAYLIQTLASLKSDDSRTLKKNDLATPDKNYLEGWVGRLRGLLPEIDAWVQFRETYEGYYFQGQKARAIGGIELDEHFAAEQSRPDGMVYVVQGRALILVGLLESKAKAEGSNQISSHVLKFMHRYRNPRRKARWPSQKKAQSLCVPNAGTTSCFEPDNIYILLNKEGSWVQKPLQASRDDEILSLVRGALIKDKRSFNSFIPSDYTIYSRWTSLEISRIITLFFNQEYPRADVGKFFRKEHSSALVEALSMLDVYLNGRRQSRLHLGARSWSPTLELLIEWLKFQPPDSALSSFRSLLELVDVAPVGLQKLCRVIEQPCHAGETVEAMRGKLGIARRQDFFEVSNSPNLAPLPFPGDRVPIRIEDDALLSPQRPTCREALLRSA